jgi:hypothetical protein
MRIDESTMEGGDEKCGLAEMTRCMTGRGKVPTRERGERYAKRGITVVKPNPWMIDGGISHLFKGWLKYLLYGSCTAPVRLLFSSCSAHVYSTLYYPPTDLLLQ